MNDEDGKRGGDEKEREAATVPGTMIMRNSHSTNTTKLPWKARPPNLEDVIVMNRTCPETLSYDKASKEFLIGLRLARKGRLSEARDIIAGAYLLENRAVNWCVHLPATKTEQFAHWYMDHNLLLAMIEEEQSCGEGGTEITTLVLRLLLADVTFYWKGDHDDGQSSIGTGLQTIQDLLQCIEKNPTIENSSQVLRGYLRRPKLYHLQYTFYSLHLGNHQKGLKALGRALKIDPTYLPARLSRAELWCIMAVKENETCYHDLKEIVKMAHPDDCHNLQLAYGLLSTTVLVDENLGKVKLAEKYYMKSREAGKRAGELWPEYFQHLGRLVPKDFAERIFNMYWNGSPGVRGVRNYATIATPVSVSTSYLHQCIKCGKRPMHEYTGLETPLMACSRCLLVSYCSKDCQVADWPSHKILCKKHAKAN